MTKTYLLRQLADLVAMFSKHSADLLSLVDHSPNIAVQFIDTNFLGAAQLCQV